MNQPPRRAYHLTIDVSADTFTDLIDLPMPDRPMSPAAGTRRVACGR